MWIQWGLPADRHTRQALPFRLCSHIYTSPTLYASRIRRRPFYTQQRALTSYSNTLYRPCRTQRIMVTLTLKSLFSCSISELRYSQMGQCKIRTQAFPVVSGTVSRTTRKTVMHNLESGQTKTCLGSRRSLRSWRC